MDKNIFDDAGTIPALPRETLDRMTEMALSYKQHQAPVNENRARFWLFTPLRAGAFATAACVIIALGVISMESGGPAGPVTMVTHPVTTASVTDEGDSYDEITDLAILATLESF